MSKAITNEAGRTLYENFRVRLTCFHEVGHVVVGHVLGHGLRGVAVELGKGLTQFVPMTSSFVDAVTKRGRRDAEQQIRNAMAMVAAGPIAACIHQREVDDRGYRCREESRAYSTYWTLKPSHCYPKHPDLSPGSDYSVLVTSANTLTMSRIQLPLLTVGTTPKQWAKLMKPLQKEAVKLNLAEIASAEERAEKILRRYWPAVEDIAGRLHRSKSGRLTRAQLLKRLEEHGVKVKARL